jgi:uncharacterized protein YutE (UPF0331/DUF86 family)
VKRLNSLTELYNATTEQYDSIDKHQAMYIIRELVWILDNKRALKLDIEDTLDIINDIIGVDDEAPSEDNN